MYRRTLAFVMYWQDDRCHVRNFLSRRTLAASIADVEVLFAAGEWRTIDDLRRRCPRLEPSRLQRAIRRLLEVGALECSDEPPAPELTALREWAAWSPAASLLHFDSKNEKYLDRSKVPARLAMRAYDRAVDDPADREPKIDISLPAFDRNGSFPKILLARRTWRRFGARGITIGQLATLLGLTWAVQSWIRTEHGPRLGLRTSPSGGAFQSMNVYVLANAVRGLPPGAYRYEPDRHGLIRVGPAWPRAAIVRALGGQQWTRTASALFFMAADFTKAQWKYKRPRAYRVLTLEAGHFGQTFCLTATWLGLAPFSTAALRDTSIERRLKIDGIRESVLYALGVSTRPVGSAWAPTPRGSARPSLERPRHLQPAHARKRNR